MALRIILTRHAEDMLVEREFERSWIENTILGPDSVEQDQTRPGVLRAFRRIPERGDRVMRVAYVTTGETIRVLTVFLDRGRQRKT